MSMTTSSPPLTVFGGPDALSPDHDRQLLARSLCVCVVQHSAAAEDDAGGSAAFEKVTACRHDESSQVYFLKTNLFCGAV
jgi:hypothetical protein